MKPYTGIFAWYSMRIDGNVIDGSQYCHPYHADAEILESKIFIGGTGIIGDAVPFTTYWGCFSIENNCYRTESSVSVDVGSPYGYYHYVPTTGDFLFGECWLAGHEAFAGIFADHLRSIANYATCSPALLS